MEYNASPNNAISREVLVAVQELVPSLKEETIARCFQTGSPSRQYPFAIEALACVDPGTAHRDVIMNVHSLEEGSSLLRGARFYFGPALVSIQKIMAFCSENTPLVQDRRFSSTQTHRLFPLKDIQAVVVLALLFRDYRNENALVVDLSLERLRIAFPVNGEGLALPLFKQKSPNPDVETLLKRLALLDDDWYLTMEWLTEDNVLESLAKGTEIFDFLAMSMDEEGNPSPLKQIQKGILRYFSLRKEATRKEIQDYFALSERTASLYLLRLEKEGYLEKTERARSRFVAYRLKKNGN